MIAFPAMLLKPAEEAGMKVPPDAGNFDVKEYPHFQVFCNVQLGASMPSWTANWENAKLIANIPDDKIMVTTYQELLDMGLQVGTPML